MLSAQMNRRAVTEKAGGCKMTTFQPEGKLLNTIENQSCIGSMEGLRRAKESGKILEARAVLCDSQHNLMVDLCGLRGIIPREDGLVDLYSGVGDSDEGRITIDNPFAGEGKISCLL